MSGFRVHAPMDQRLPLSRVAAHARRAEALGYDGLNVPDAVHDGLAAAQAALQATTRLHVATSVLVAFPRSPMVVAVAAWDLQELSGGRFALGLGSQVRGNVVGRYATTWSAPVPRMREYVQSLRAIFACWQEGCELAFEGEHYRFTRMQPFFRPGPLEHPQIPIHTGGIGPLMVSLAGEVADGLVTHPTNCAPRYLREVIRPRLERGAARVGRDAADVSLMVGPLTATGPDERATAAAREQTRQLLTFLYSTPSYRPSLELFGWEDRGEKLHALSRARRWGEMAGVVDDEMLDTLAPSGSYDEIVDVLRSAYAGLTDWITFPMPEDPAHDAAAAEVVAALRAG
ncbi:MAG: TIGR03617 family F420-dependent LLM class oxidoreductase [Myxococcota bacterium]|nr:TIGR03617 family F420-dependent LLM class oxidoreductase [Myxococcota bacterium]